ncbi:DUF6923 family protein [Allorhizocola rhizosphaerae]|uniref:DUF6923 family protein n=1 Tax=Allorhizocola rhizosphaerae TaxID=1872709 RepID=UPI0013C2B95B|nr:GEVED domain-containing protein [Allorhizocola rhizosphaerae]
MSGFVAMLLVPILAVPVGPLAQPTPACRNGFYLVHGQRLRQFDEFGDRSEPVARLPVTLNAAGYVPGADVLIGLSGGRVVNVDRAGTVTDRGAAPAGLAGANAATVSGGRWLVRAGGELVAVDTSSLAVVRRVGLSAHIDVDDWDVNPADGKLYGLATGLLQTSLVRVDPASGEVARVFSFGLLPLTDSYGAVAVDMHGTLHALHNGTGRMYHMPLSNPARFTVTNPGLHSGTSDAAGCPVEWDYSTAPDSYGSARHTITHVGELTLAASPGSVPADATSFGVDVSVTNTTGRPALLAAWHDFDLDGRFGASELVTTTVTSTGVVSLHWPSVVVGASGDRAWLRLRLYGRKAGTVHPTGTASGGGVEDYPIRIVRPRAPQAPVVPPATPPPAGEQPPSPSPSASPAPPASAIARAPKVIEAKQKPSPRLPLTLALFTGMLIPAIVVVARGAARRRSSR